jgi:hypothetical protein
LKNVLHGAILCFVVQKGGKMENNEQPAGKIIAWRASAKELDLIKRLCEVHKRASTSDLLRFLVMQEAEKILAPDVLHSTN